MDEVFSAAADADFIRHLNIAAYDFGRLRPRTLIGSVTLVADQSNYTAPSDLRRLVRGLWGTAEKRARQPWDANWPGRLPAPSVIYGAAGARYVRLEPAPTTAQITDLGATYEFSYCAGHVIGVNAVDTSIELADQGLLLLRAQAETMKELAARNARKPVAMRDGLAGSPKNGTPAALAEQLMREFERQAA
jgi:hypothetical protein